MKRSKMLAGALALLPAAGLLAITQLADAHHPDIEASAVCEAELAKVTISVTSWTETDEPARRADQDIVVTWDDVVIGHGAFTAANNYHFTLSYTAPANGTTHVARATAAAPFGPNGEYGFQGAYREVSLKVPTDCLPPATTTTTSTTVAPATTTTVQVQVLGETVTRPPAALPVEVLPKFAG